jgi:hypothetical protein
MLIIGVDYHPSDQYIAFADIETGECGERRLNQNDGEAEKFYQKIMEGNNIGSALTQDVVTHYDPPTNRCYGELDVNTADLSKFTDDYSRYVYDAQTGELLASVSNDHGKKTAYVKDGGGFKATDWDQAIIQIESLMADDRKQ